MTTDTAQLYGAGLCQHIKQTTDFSPIIQTMISEGSVESAQEAQNDLDAFLQWIALVPALERGNTFVMLKTSVDEVFHAMILNTRFYQEFCDRYFGFFIHHEPIGEEHVNGEIDKGVHYTVDLLEQTYGDALHPSLREWRDQVNSGVYVVSCPSCVDDMPMHNSTLGKLPNGAKIAH